MKSTKIIGVIIASSITLGMATPAFALGLGASAHTNIEASTTGGNIELRGEVKANAGANRIANAKTHADQEIERRTAALTDLNTRIQAMAKVSASVKSTLEASITSQISALTDLKTKIDADTATDTLKVDIQSITKSYRIFMLIIPQARVAAAVDVVGTVGDSMTAVGAKLQTRITTAQNAGKDVTTLTAALSDMTAKIADANTQAGAALSETVALTPDNGDQAKMQSNNKVIADAKVKLKAASADLRAARQDIQKILVALKGFHLDASASSTTSVNH